MLRRHFMTGTELPDFIITYYAPQHIPFSSNYKSVLRGYYSNDDFGDENNTVFKCVLDKWKDGIGEYGIKILNWVDETWYNRWSYKQFADITNNNRGSLGVYVDVVNGEYKDVMFFADTITDVILPNEIKHLKGSLVSSYLDEYNHSVVNVILPENLETLSNHVLRSLHALKTITIPSSVIYMDTYTLQINCYDDNNMSLVPGNYLLEEIIMKPVVPPNTDTNRSPIGVYDPDQYINPNLKIRVYADCVDTYKNDAVWGQYNELYDTINNIICYTTKSGNKISASISIYFPNSTQILQDDRWLVCTQEPIVNLPAAFKNKSDLNTIALPNSIISIEENAFRGSSLNSIRLGNNIKTIGQYCFRESSLNEIVIPSSVTTIGHAAFTWCYLLSSITVDDNNPIYDSRNNCNAIIETATNTLILGCDNTIIPNSVTSIENNAFTGCKNLTSITIPNSVTSIENNAFNSCKLLTSVSINSDAIVNKDYPSNASFFNIFGTQVTEYIIGEGITRIGDYVFYNCQSITSIVIPNSVTSIGKSAFYYCSSLNSITFEGTIEQWNAVIKGLKWNVTVPATVVHCTDGDVEI